MLLLPFAMLCDETQLADEQADGMYAWVMMQAVNHQSRLYA
jgi:hypothetical protein